MGQQILMKIGSVTAADGEQVKALEFQVTAPSTFSGGGGAGHGKAIPGYLSIKKDNGKSTTSFLKDIVDGSHLPEVIFEYYKASDKEPYYTITLTDALITQLYWLSPECPTCLKLEMQVGFVFKKYKTFDAESGQTITWDIQAGAIK